MNPKGKANELFVKFRILACDETIEQRERTAKECCKITLKELIDNSIEDQVNYWRDVLEEVIKIK